MSFGGGFGGFGSNNNQSSGGFGGFGSNTNTTSGGFGSGTGGFGSNNATSGGLFGNNSNANTAGGFGSTGGFGSGTGGFGSKPAFGSTGTTTGGLFGGSNTNNTTNSAFGGFGAANNNAATTTTSAFGSGNTNTGGGLFGNANKTGFGSNPTGSSLFGGNANTANTANTGTGFGGFGSANLLGGGAAGAGDPPGTAITAFQPFTEKEPNSTTQTNSFQNIGFQDPYKKWSGDELRLVDYAQGRRHGNASGAGAFGVGSGFGGFGSNNTANAANTNQTTGAFGSATTNTGGGLFGAGNTANTGSGFGTGAFGSNTNATTTGTTGGLFGNANKPGGLFGNTAQNQTGGMFGSNNNAATTGFGSTTNTNNVFGSAANANNTAAGGGGLFGSNANQAKPQGTGFSFGTANNTTSTGFGGGATNNAFGTANNTTTGTGLFGNTAGNNQASGGGLFGIANNNAQQNTTSSFGGGFGQQNQTQQSGGLFGGAQQKPATGGLFGSTPANTNTGGGLFGATPNQQQQGGGLFGSNTNTQLNANTGTGTGTGTGGLFGGLGANTQNQQAAGTGLFGAATNQQKPGGLFGGGTTSTGTGLFGATNNQAQGSSLFGGNANAPQQQNPNLGSSLLGNPQQASIAPQGLTANLNDISAYGSPALFANIGGSEVPNPGPLAVPLGGNAKPRRSGFFPMQKFNPAASTRFSNSPQKRGFGFSYSTYGTPPNGGSATGSTTASPLGRSLLGTTPGNSLARSVSANNLRRNYNTEDSILLPGAFTNANNTRWLGTAGSKKLVINRDLRSDLFSTPQKDKSGENNGTRKLTKRVSFDTAIEDEDDSPVRAALPAPNDVPSSPSETAARQQTKGVNIPNGTKTPEMEQVKEKELGIVQEEDQSTPDSMTNGFDNVPGGYWMEPSIEEIQNMNRVQRQKIDNFTVGRENVGSITFKVPVDISSIALDEICGGIIQLEPRSATVYPVSAKKPPVGKGLNVPARISLEQSWPRGNRERRIANDPKRLNKHVERLKRIMDTTFESYDGETGVWTFSVEHFTTYGLDDSDEDSDEDITQDMPMPVIPQSLALKSSAGGDGDGQRRGLPGAFDENEELVPAEAKGASQSFLGVSSADSATHDVKLSLETEYTGDSGAEYDMSEDEDLTRSPVGQHLAAEHEDISSEGAQDTKKSAPGGILRARMRAIKYSTGPIKLEVADGNDWTGMLKNTVSPAKRDRHMLREMIDSPLKKSVRFDKVEDEGEYDFRKSSIWSKSVSKPDRSSGLAASTMGMDQGRGFATSIDLMNSLFEKPKPKPAGQNLDASLPYKGFPKWPYERQDKILTAEENEQAFHNASKPSWGPNEILVLARRSSNAALARRPLGESRDIISLQRSGIQTEGQELCVARFTTPSSNRFLQTQDLLTEIHVTDGVPSASLDVTSLRKMFHHQDMNGAASIHEKQVWELASILFDSIAEHGSNEAEHFVRRRKLSQFWSELVESASSAAVGSASTSEEKAVACLAGHRIPEACKHLLDSKNFRLGTLVALIGSSDSGKKDMKEQIKAWHESKMLSEFTEAIRTIYELLAGNVCVCEGLKGVPVEDRVDSFVISTKFGLDWRQAFGLRLWYAISNEDDLSIAVSKFQEDIDQDREEVPRPWYAEQGIPPLWEDGDGSRRQDLLWGLLQLYADPNADLEAILAPENHQLSPLDSRLRWQLGLALTSTGRVTYGRDGREKADAATLAYASQLTSAGEWLEAIFVLLHLSGAAARKKAIQEHLCRHAGLIGAEGGTTFNVLTDKYRIPAEWVWEALALYMRSVKKDARAEVQCLLRSGSVVEAHRVLVAQVAPQAIIGRDYDALSSLMSQFRERQGLIAEWTLGGEIYSLFLQLVQCRAHGESAPVGLLDRLLAGLTAMKESGAEEEEMVKYAAVSDMANETAREIMLLTGQKKDADLRSRIIGLPLTQDRLLAYSVDLSLDGYREVMTR